MDTTNRVFISYPGVGEKSEVRKLAVHGFVLHYFGQEEILDSQWIDAYYREPILVAKRFPYRLEYSTLQALIEGYEDED